MKDKRTPVTITTRAVGVNFGVCGQVRRRGRIIHETDPPRPLGCNAAAADDARAWAIDHGYIDVDDSQALKGGRS